MRFKFRRWHFGLISLALIIFVAIHVRAMREKIQNSSALYSSALMVVEYMDRNSGNWPKSWDDLRTTDIICRQPGQPGAVDRVKERIVIDWNARPQQLLVDSGVSDVASFQVIQLSNDTASQNESLKINPNQIVLDYLRSVRDKEQLSPHDPAEFGTRAESPK